MEWKLWNTRRRTHNRLVAGPLAGMISESCRAHLSTSNPARLVFPYNGTLLFPGARSSIVFVVDGSFLQYNHPMNKLSLPIMLLLSLLLASCTPGLDSTESARQIGSNTSVDQLIVYLQDEDINVQWEAR
jgi:hypothetical protein